MGGSGGGGYGGGTNPSDLAREVRKSAQQVQNQQYQVDSTRLIDSLLIAANNRDNEQIQSELDRILQALHGDIDGSLKLLFGGSVAKHTYVDGLSDIDCLVLLDKSELMGKSPQEVREYFAAQLHDRFPRSEVKVGDLCVTLRFGHRQIQLLPAMKSMGKFRIPEIGGKRWSTIDPRAFTSALTNVNQLRGGIVVPTIKLVKSIISDFPENRRLSGYHVEALAVEIFKSYTGPTTKKSMLMHFFSAASERVLQPAKDMTGQSTFIDDHLGKSRSLPRQLVSDGLARIHRKMQNAEDFGQTGEWETIFQAQLLRHEKRTG